MNRTTKNKFNKNASIIAVLLYTVQHRKSDNKFIWIWNCFSGVSNIFYFLNIYYFCCIKMFFLSIFSFIILFTKIPFFLIVSLISATVEHIVSALYDNSLIKWSMPQFKSNFISNFFFFMLILKCFYVFCFWIPILAVYTYYSIYI